MSTHTNTLAPSETKEARPSTPLTVATDRSARRVNARPRTAVIVAAGKGGRLIQSGADPKPLVHLVGVPLIQRVMAAAARAGIDRFVVVIGYGAERMREVLPGLVPDGTELELVENPRFDDPNGVSLLAATHCVEEPFALLMSDHVFSADRLVHALDRFAETACSLLAVEARERFTGDLADATRVAVHDGKVTEIGKELERFDAIDTGMFVLDGAEIRAALEASGTAPSISDGVRRLARDGRLDALLLESGYWQDVDTPDDLRLAERRLYTSLTKASDGFLARHVNRRVSLFFSTRLWRYGVTPNQVTSFTLVLGLGAGVAFAQGATLGWGLLGACLFQLQSIVDGVDGELARLLHKESRSGFWYDLTVDNLTHMAVFGGIALGQIHSGNPGPWTALGWLAVVGVAASFAVMAPLLAPGRKRPRSGLLQRMLDGLSRRDFTYLLFPLAALGWLGGFLWAAALGTWAYALAVSVLRSTRKT